MRPPITSKYFYHTRVLVETEIISKSNNHSRTYRICCFTDPPRRLDATNLVVSNMIEYMISIQSNVTTNLSSPLRSQERRRASAVRPSPGRCRLCVPRRSEVLSQYYTLLVIASSPALVCNRLRVSVRSSCDFSAFVCQCTVHVCVCVCCSCVFMSENSFLKNRIFFFTMVLVCVCVCVCVSESRET